MTALSKKKDRFERVEMLIGVATKALRIKFDQLHPPATLQETLRTYQTEIMPYLDRDQEIIDYGKIDTVSSCKMDIKLMVCVLRNTGLPEPHSTFNCMPDKDEINDGADTARINFYRNELLHSIDKELNDQEFEEISQTLIEVITRFSGSLFDDEIRCIMEKSLDRCAGSLTWHVHAAIHALNEKAIQPTKALVIQLYQHQPLHYSFFVGTVLAYGMNTIFENL